MNKLHRYRRQTNKMWQRWSHRYLRHHPYVVPTTMFLLGFFLISASFVVVNGQTIGPSDSRIVQVYVDGEKEVVPTRAADVQELLGKLDVKLNEADVIEPALETPILEDNFKITIYRAQPVTIIDGDKKIQFLTAQEDPRLAVEQAGISVYPEDHVETERNADLIKEGTLGKKLTIDRATPITLNLYGNPVMVRTRAETVRDLLDEKDVVLAPDDNVQPSLDTELTPNTSIVVARFGTKIETREESIPFETESTDDPNKLAGETVITTPGVPGKRIVTYEIQLENDKEAGRKQIQSIVALEPIKQKVVKGTKVIYSNPSENVELGRRIAEETGVGGEFSCLYQLWERESKWNHLAGNRSTGAYGIPQALPGSKMGPGWQTDPEVQIRWGLNYVKKYGGPCGAWRFWQVNHWY